MLRLASTSPRRKKLLKEAGFRFRYTSSDFEEHMPLRSDPVRLAVRNAEGKAFHASAKTGIVLACDTLIAFKGRIVGKPKGRKQAFEYLKGFSGHTHQVISGVALIDLNTESLKSFHVQSDVTFRKISDEDIHDYLDIGEYKDKAGAYGYQSEGRRFILKISGSKTNVIGLPMSETKRELRKFGILPDRT